MSDKSILDFPAVLDTEDSDVLYVMRGTGVGRDRHQTKLNLLKDVLINGIPEWTGTRSYLDELSVVNLAGDIYQAIQGNGISGDSGENIAKDPATEPTWWLLILSKNGAVNVIGNQTVAGIKTFSSIPVLPASDPTTDNQATRKSYVDNFARPVGSYYVQYPDADSNTDSVEFPTAQRPATLFGGTWIEQWSADSIFFRTRGVNSGLSRVDGFQDFAIGNHDHRINSGKGSHGHGITDPGHAHTVEIRGQEGSNTIARHSSQLDTNIQATSTNTTGIIINNATLPQIDTDSVINAQVSTEARVANRRIKVWKRTV